MKEINLAGDWKVAISVRRNFPTEEEFKDIISLPATTEMAQIGDDTPVYSGSEHLARKYPVCGKVYYRKEIEITDDMASTDLELYLERTKYTKVYIDGKRVSESHETIVPQRHRISRLTSGLHVLIIEVDNDLESYEDFPSILMNGHQYTDHTQTNWNGIIGQIKLILIPDVYICSVNIWKSNEENEISIILDVESVIQKRIHFNMQLDNASYIMKAEEERELSVGINRIRLTIYPESKLKAWNEFETVLYHFKMIAVDYDTELEVDDHEEIIGFCDSHVKDKKIFVSNMAVFLRGSVDCCIYPLTGYPPMTANEWTSIFNLYKEYGMNHCRFHSWCPPEAAFQAADSVGIYLQIEMPGFAVPFYLREDYEYDDILNRYYYDQAVKIIKQYGNHPSFLIFAIGNELNGNIRAYTKLLRYLKEIRPDLLYTQGANNFLENPICSPEDDVWITMRTSPNSNIRTSFSHNDLPLGHIQTKAIASTQNSYENEVALSDIPLVAHEIGQFQVCPNLNEENMYRGVLQSNALRIYREQMKEKGLLSKAEEFYQASGRLAVQLYKEEIESNLRTEGMSGFQLLGLQDFTGQGTAFVGILNSFLQSKNLISSEDWRRFCAPAVILVKISSYVYTVGEPISLQVLLYNYGCVPINSSLKVSLTVNHETIAEWKGHNINCVNGHLHNLGELILETEQSAVPAKAELKVEFGNIRNIYPIWIYPKEDIEELGDIVITDNLSEQDKEWLTTGGKILLTGGDQNGEIEGFFPTDFWCYPMFAKACIQSGKETAPGNSMQNGSGSL